MILGLTGHDPNHWDLGRHVTSATYTWCFDTYSGDTWEAGRKGRVCEQWTKRYSTCHTLTRGDTLTLLRTRTGSVPVVYNNDTYTDVFTNVPTQPLWVVILLHVKRLALLPYTTPRNIDCSPSIYSKK